MLNGSIRQIIRIKFRDHGYDINSIKNLKIKKEGNFNLINVIICGADEKIVRLFEPTEIVANLLNKIIKNLFEIVVANKKNELEYKTFTEGGAQVLGLMTKAVQQAKEKIYNYYDEEDGV